MPTVKLLRSVESIEMRTLELAGKQDRDVECDVLRLHRRPVYAIDPADRLAHELRGAEHAGHAEQGLDRAVLVVDPLVEEIYDALRQRDISRGEHYDHAIA